MVLVGLAGIVLLAAGCTSGSPSGHRLSPAPSGTPTRTGPDVYAACMRGHGVAEFPDPGPSGLLYIGPHDTFDTDSPGYLAAYEACQHLA
ncbi:hypothetical protein AB0J80_37635 [Actinoplanes sp. NPDC049548]|uniref:hypothetical protein n=1 Tax=Actinoplanes sp. NPDC049548 TaxID=3155152 RepID=UPI00343F6BD5